jgi:hypothetical protein
MFDESCDDEERFAGIPCPMGQCLIGFLLGSLFGYIAYLLVSNGICALVVSIAIGLGTTIGVVSSSIPSQNPCEASYRELLSGLMSSVPVSWFILQHILVISETSWGLSGIILTAMMATLVQWVIRNVTPSGGRSGHFYVCLDSLVGICKSLFSSSRRLASHSHRSHASKVPLDSRV